MEKFEIDTKMHVGISYGQSLDDYKVIDSSQKCEEVFDFLTKRFRMQSLQALAILRRLSLANQHGFGIPAIVLYETVEKIQKGQSQTKDFEIHTWLYSLGLSNLVIAQVCRKKSTDETVPFIKLNHEAVGKWAEAEMLKFVKDDPDYTAFLDTLEKAHYKQNKLDDYERIN